MILNKIISYSDLQMMPYFEYQLLLEDWKEMEKQKEEQAQKREKELQQQAQQQPSISYATDALINDLSNLKIADQHTPKSDGIDELTTDLQNLGINEQNNSSSVKKEES